MSLKRDLLLGAVQLPRETVEVPGLGTFTVQGMTGTQRDAFEESLVALSSNGRKRSFSAANIRAKLIVHCVVDDETGEPLFKSDEVEAVGKIRADVLDRLYAVAKRLCGVSDQDVEELSKK